MTELDGMASIRWILDRTGGLFLLGQLLAHIKIQAFLERGLGEQEALLLDHFTIDLSHPGHGDFMLGGNLRKGQDTSQSVLLDAQNQVGHSAHIFLSNYNGWIMAEDGRIGKRSGMIQRTGQECLTDAPAPV